MIYGVINLRREATLPLVVGNSSGQQQVIDTVVDTGFDGFLSLPSEIIVRLELPWMISNPATLGDGSETVECGLQYDSHRSVRSIVGL
jgi:predicted aspartyl protease